MSYVAYHEKIVKNDTYPNTPSRLQKYRPDTKQIKDESLIQKRYSICQECPELISLTKQCKLCGCWMPGKTRLSSAECPVGKWKKEE